MYPFNINSTQNPISFDSQSYQHRPLFMNDDNNNNNNYYPINSKEFDNFPSPSSNSLLQYLPSPQQYEKDAVFELTWQQLHDLFFHQTESNMERVEIIDDENEENENEQIKQDDHHYQTTTIINQQINTAVPPRKRSSKKDRHSKITTASGVRDRRMRLSLPVARKFFGLQDMLGFDKASKTIEWLLTQSSSAIQQTSMKFIHQTQGGITHYACSSFSSTSDCISTESPKTVKSKTVKSTCKEKKKAAKNARGTAIAKESRKNARERARKRTMEKKKNDSESKSNSLGRGEEEEEMQLQNGSKIISPPLLPLQEVQYLSSLVISSNWNTSSALCNFDQNQDIPIQQEEYGSTLWY